MMKSVQVDKGAIKFVLSGANIMCRGLTSPGGRLPEGLEAGEPVAIFAEGKENPLAVGELAMSSDEMYVLLIDFLSCYIPFPLLLVVRRMMVLALTSVTT